ncbi:DUF397 domain-containing protein [Streptomyces virginiae]|uniref:DUF397 domain-containing protein n=1 Tax=Streptomyces virginiae TaxID=1961 RepID=UPI00368266BF
MAGQLSSNAEGGNCVGVAACPGAVHVRDSKVPVGPRLARSTEAGPPCATPGGPPDGTHVPSGGLCGGPMLRPGLPSPGPCSRCP